MTLHEAIQRVLKENSRPMTAMDIASFINLNDYYSRSDREPIQSSQILARVKNYESLFQNVNGYVILVEDESWKNLLTSYWYLVNTLRGIYILADIQFIIATLLYYKRLVDTNKKPGRKYPVEFDTHLESDFSRLLDGGQSFLEGLRSLEIYHIAPEGIFEECSRLLVKLDRSKIIEIWAVIRNIHTEQLNDKEFGNIYEYFLTLDSLDGYKSSINHTPFSLRELMVNILDPKSGKSLYDPVAGTGGLLIQSYQHYSGIHEFNAIGSEINKRVAQLGNMNLFMHGIGGIRIEAKDCFEEINHDKKYDYVIGDLPSNGITNSLEHSMLYRQYNLEPPKSGKSFGSLVLLALSKLNNEGKAVLTVSDGFLLKKGKEKEIRDLLIGHDVIQSIISLPYGTLRPYTDAKASLLVLNKNKPDHLLNRIQFIAGQAIDQNAKSLILNNDEILHSFIGHETLSKNAQIIDISDLQPDANLSADAYDAQFLIGNLMLKEGKGKLLSDLVEIKAGINPEKLDIHIEGDIPLIKVESLSKDILDLNLDTHLKDWISRGHRYSRASISQPCILVARIGDNLKPTIFRPTNAIPEIIPHSNVYALIANKELDIDIEYLYYQLHSIFILEQIEKRKLGAVMPYVSIKGLKEIVVPYMRLQSQIEFVDSQKANLIADERNRIEEKIKALGYKEETKQAESDVIKTLTHQLRPTFLELNNMTKRIERIVLREKLGELKEYDQVKLEEFLDPEIGEYAAVPDNFTLTQLLEKLSKDTNHLSNILTSVDKVMNFKLLPEDLIEVDVLDFLASYRHSKEIEQHNGYNLIVKGDSAKVLMDKISFTELLDQLLINAEKHAFIEKNIQRTNNVQFMVRYDKQREVVVIEYSNNGSPYDLTQKDFTTAFEKGNKSKGSGIGGNYINRIVEAHKGKLVVEEKYKKGFLLKIELPTINNKEL